MRFISLEKEAGVLDWSVDKGSRAADFVAGLVGKGLSAGAGKAVKVVGKQLEKKPLSTVAKGALLATTVPIGYRLTSQENYLRRYDKPEFKNELYSSGPSQSSTKYAGYGMRVSNYLEKEASTVDALSRIVKDAPVAIGSLGLAGALNSLFGASLKQSGENLKRNIFPESDRMNIADEIAKSRAEAIGKFEADRYIDSLESKHKERAELPKAQHVLTSLRSHDPLIGQAYKNPAMKQVIDQTANAVYSFAPNVAKNDRAMQSILTEALTSPEGGLSFQTIKSLAETQSKLSGN